MDWDVLRAYFLPGDTTILYASTFTGDSACPEVPERGAGGAYVWPITKTSISM